jgi:hypothetical protein
MPSMTGVAASWKYICQAVEESNKKNIMYLKNSQNKNQIFYHKEFIRMI